MARRYCAIIVVYALCLLAPLTPGFAALSGALFGSAHSSRVILYALIFLIALVAVLSLLWAERSLPRAPGASTTEKVLWACLGLFALYACEFAALMILSIVTGQPAHLSQHSKNVVDMTNTAPVFLFIVAIVGPILEEIIFRKIFFGSLRKHMRGVPGFFAAAVPSSLVFAVLHMDIPFLLVYFSIGMLLCFVYDRTRRIWVTMCMHAELNAMALLFSYLLKLQFISLFH
ncbi:MAG: type II CAAX endopeptidase family protein [Sporolactobacillus sp.]